MLNDYIEKKLKYNNLIVFASAILCGIAMGFVSAFSIVLGVFTSNVVISKLIYGAAFSSLLLLVVLNGYELFTGNTMLLTALHKKENVKKILLNLLLVYCGNLVGCLLSAWLIKAAGIHDTFALGEPLSKIYTVKTKLSVGKMLLLGILANFFVCMGVYLSHKSKTIVEKYLSLFFPICIFCVLGFEHSIANMFTLFYAAFINGNTIAPILLNLLFVTLGNIIGGVAFGFSTKLKDRTIKE